MKPFLLFFLSHFFCLLVFSQASDFIVVKKHDRTVKSYFPGLPIVLQTNSYSWVNGWITAIRHDSIFVKQYDVRQVPTIWGTTMTDTAGSYLVGVHYNEIQRIEFNEKGGGGFSFVTNGTIFMIGGLGYAVLNVVNGQYLHESITDSKNMTSLGIALSVAAAGFILNRISHHKNKKWKYAIEYIRMNDVKKQLRGF